MKEKRLIGKKVALLSADGFEKSELFKPKEALEKEGAEVFVISLKSGEIRAWDNKDWSDETIAVEYVVSDVKAEDFDALLLPGGVINPDLLRNNDDAVSFVRDFATAGKPIAAICHGPQTLINADVVKGRKMTSYSSVRKDLENAGARWVDSAVVVDQGLVTSRKPDDIPEFNRMMIEEFAEGIHENYHRTHLTEAERMGLQ